MLAGRKGIFIQTVQINQLVVGQLTVAARQEEVDDPHLEAVVAAKIGTVNRSDFWEAELHISGGS
jgi:hypothetical protein